MDSVQELVAKDKLVAMISKNLGSTTADLYRDFYKTKDLPTATVSARELLTEVIGKERAVAELAQIT